MHLRRLLLRSVPTLALACATAVFVAAALDAPTPPPATSAAQVAGR